LVKYILLQEYIKLGQRVQSFTVDAWKDNAWQQVANATTIGYKRILEINPVDTDKIRINITASKDCPALSAIEVY
jgi:alpha-L-fucosidase